jgi:hypothetical protein
VNTCQYNAHAKKVHNDSYKKRPKCETQQQSAATVHSAWQGISYLGYDTLGKQGHKSQAGALPAWGTKGLPKTFVLLVLCNSALCLCC